ncbi:MAG: hypothetical protein WCG05_03230 [Alphaproteobacteria bacterium]
MRLFLIALGIWLVGFSAFALRPLGCYLKSSSECERFGVFITELKRGCVSGNQKCALSYCKSQFCKPRENISYKELLALPRFMSTNYLLGTSHISYHQPFVACGVICSDPKLLKILDNGRAGAYTTYYKSAEQDLEPYLTYRQQHQSLEVIREYLRMDRTATFNELFYGASCFRSAGHTLNKEIKIPSKTDKGMIEECYKTSQELLVNVLKILKEENLFRGEPEEYDVDELVADFLKVKKK